VRPAGSEPVIAKAMLSKIRRSFVKAQRPIDEKAIAAYASELITAGVNIMEQRSSRIAKVLKGELDAKELR